AQCLEHGELRYSLTDRLHHAVTGHEQQQEEYCAENGIHKHISVAEILHPRFGPRPFRAGPRRGAGAREHPVYCPCDLRAAARILDTDQEAVNGSLIGSAALIQVLIVTYEPLALTRIIEIVCNRDDVEGPDSVAVRVSRIRLQRYRVSNFPPVPVGQKLTHDRAGSGLLQLL